MELFIDPTEKHRFQLADAFPDREGMESYWFEINAEMPHRVRRAIERESLRARVYVLGRDGMDSSAEMDLGAARRTLLYESVVAWNFTRKGRPMPVMVSSFDDLPDWLVQKMTNLVDDYYAARERSPDEKKSPESSIVDGAAVHTRGDGGRRDSEDIG